MKKLLAILAAIVVLALPMAAKDRIYHNSEPLPAAARTTLSKNFPKAEVNRVKVDSHIFGGDEYEVILSNGTEIEFDSNGEWKEVDCGHLAVPNAFVLKPIAQYVTKNYPGQKIVKVSKDRNKYEIELSNGIDLDFDRAGAFLRVDD